MRGHGILPVTLRSVAACAALAVAASSSEWPDLSRPARAIGGGGRDAAVVVAIQDYVFVPGVAGAKSNGNEWYQYLSETLGVPEPNIKLLTNEDATREEILDATRKMSERVGRKGTLWFVFVGHGAPSADGKDGLLIGVDAQQKAESLQARSVRRSELLKALSESPAASIRVVLDACFSGRGQDGAALAAGLQPLMVVAPGGSVDPRMAVLTAAKGNQFAGALPGTKRPAFSYLVLGGLRGWAADKNGNVTAGSLWKYASKALSVTLRGRDQTPDLLGSEDSLVGVSAGEKGPNLSSLAQETAGSARAEDLFKVTSLTPLPNTQAPGAIAGMSVEADFRNLDMEALQKYNEAVEFDESRAAPELKSARWRELAKSAPKFKEKADARAEKWDRYAKELIAGAETRLKMTVNRDNDWDKLSKLLAMKVVSPQDKKRWASAFVEAYGKTEDENPYLSELAAYLPEGTVAAQRESIGGVRWVTIAGGSFIMGSKESRDEKPPHKVTVPTFQIAKTLVTKEQFFACMKAGACPTPPSCNWPPAPGEDQLPVVCVDWHQARSFSKWVGGRLPTEAEWEYAARSAGRDWKYPWGNEDPTCELAAIVGCPHRGPRAVCSLPDGNTKQGLCDMAGNVWEWTQDRYFGSYSGAPTDGSAREKSAGIVGGILGVLDASGRVYRGGSWNHGVVRARAAARNVGTPTYRFDDLGFRPAR